MNPPVDEDCCHSDCRNCVFDVYEQQKNRQDPNALGNGENALSFTQYRPFALVNIAIDSQHTNVYTFIPKETGKRVRYNPGQHAVLKHVISQNPKSEDEPSETRLSRAYTLIPWECSNYTGSLSAAIKLYDTGKMSSVIRQWTLGDICFWRGPYDGADSWTYKTNHVENIIMICMGTGIAPMFALVSSITQDEQDDTCVKILHASRTPNEIVLRKPIRDLCKFWNVACTHFLSEGFDETEKKFDEVFVRGRIQEENLVEACKRTGKLEVLVCGSEGFNTSIRDTLILIGVSKKDIIIFS